MIFLPTTIIIVISIPADIPPAMATVFKLYSSADLSPGLLESGTAKTKKQNYSPKAY